MLLRSAQIPTHAEAGPEPALARLLDVLSSLVESQGIRPEEMRAIGVDSAGIVDPSTNRVVDSPNLRTWEDFPLADRLQERFGVPVFLENDVNAMAYGEWRCGAGRGTRNMLALTLGTGVGGGLILDGRLYRGAHGAAGELGHMSLDIHGQHCNCPNIGCLERHIGASWITERANHKIGSDARPSVMRGLPAEELTPHRLSIASEAGDGIAADILQETGELLGYGLVSLVNIFDPERVVIGGGVALAGHRLFDPALRIVQAHAMKIPAQKVQLVAAQLGNDAAIVGAALLAVERVGTLAR